MVKKNKLNGHGILDITKKLVYGRTSYSPSSQRVLDKVGNETITKMFVYRYPLPKFFLLISNVISKQNFDNLFHLFLIVETSSGHRVLIEKNSQINVAIKFSLKDSSDYQEIINPPQITINELLSKTNERMKDKFFYYSAAKNNCQDFLLNVLQANGINQSHDFIKQNTEQIFKSHPELIKFCKIVTDLDAKIDILKQGGRLI